MTLVIKKPTSGKLVMAKTYVGIDDPDAANYIALVEAADTAAGSPGGLETATKIAIHSFVKGCKADGIWPAIKASCILAGARTLSGALVPLVGTAPTNVGPFVSGDYDRKTGLGDTSNSSKYLNSNRAENQDPDNSHHLAVFVTTVDPRPPTMAGANSNHLGCLGPGLVSGTSISVQSDSNAYAWSRSQFTPTVGNNRPTTNTLFGVARSGSGNMNVLSGGTLFSKLPNNPGYVNATALQSYVLALNSNGSAANYCRAKIAFYSIGSSLSLSLLSSRVTALHSAIGAAIP